MGPHNHGRGQAAGCGGHRHRHRHRWGWRASADRLLVIVGSPNVGKSVVFNALTGAYVTVSNYPGTTVELTRGRGRIGRHLYEVIDTPGMYSLMPITGEERVARHILLHERPDCVLHVIDAKNASRMLPLTLQLVEAGLPVVVAANMMDEAERMGMVIDTDLLARRLGRAVVPTVATTGRGLGELRREIEGVTDGHKHAG